MYAEERLKAEIVQEALEKKVVKPSRRKEIAQQTVQEREISIRLACEALGISEPVIVIRQSCLVIIQS